MHITEIRCALAPIRLPFGRRVTRLIADFVADGSSAQDLIRLRQVERQNRLSPPEDDRVSTATGIWPMARTTTGYFMHGRVRRVRRGTGFFPPMHFPETDSD